MLAFTVDFEQIENFAIVERLVEATKGKVTIYIPALLLANHPNELDFLHKTCVGLHGLNHEHITEYSSQATVIDSAVKLYNDFFGHFPKGWRSPFLDFNMKTLQTLVHFGFKWDSSYKRSVITPLRKLLSPIRLIPIDARISTVLDGTVMVHCWELTDSIVELVAGRGNLVRHDEL